MSRRPSFVRRIVPLLATTLLLCASLPALALGLGQIVVKSKPGQPLVAEIPIISSDPDELQGLQAQLASPETFARVGLAPPAGLVADLDFSFDQDASGRPLIRVATQQPVQQPELVFLLEVDWGSGRLVREYSALVDAPRSLAAPAPEPLQMPTPVPADTVEREPLPETQAAPVAQTPTAIPASKPVPEANPTNAVPSSAPVAPPAPAPPPSTASVPNAGGAVSVQRGDTLGRIAADIGSGRSLEQTMLALLRANPEAFIDGNVNMVKAGAVLRVPDAGEFDATDRQQAAAIVQQQVQRWRGLRTVRAQPQPEATGSAAAVAGEAREARAMASRAAGARLEIAPPSSSDAKRAGTRSGIEAGGEGEMLQQELQQTRETLSARDAEVAELKTRVADLEKLQKEQQQLISMKDSALAGAQQDLAKAREARTVQEPGSPAQKADNPMWWPWLLVPALALVAGWWFLRRRRASAAPTPSRFDSARLAAAVPNKPEPKPEVATTATPAWTREEPKPAPAPTPAAPAKPVWQAPQADTIVPLNTAPAGRERLELARAYIDLGDDATARSLLLEVIDGGDLEARAEAQRLLGGMA